MWLCVCVCVCVRVLLKYSHSKTCFCPKLNKLKLRMGMEQARTDSKVTSLVKVEGDFGRWINLISIWPETAVSPCTGGRREGIRGIIPSGVSSLQGPGLKIRAGMGGVVRQRAACELGSFVLTEWLYAGIQFKGLAKTQLLSFAVWIKWGCVCVCLCVWHEASSRSVRVPRGEWIWTCVHDRPIQFEVSQYAFQCVLIVCGGH